MRTLGMVALAAIGLLLLDGVVRADVLRVPSQYSTIQQALDAAASGDSVLVAPGTYTNCDGGPCSANAAILKAGVALLSEAGPAATVLRVDSPAGGLSVVYASGIATGGAVLKGFTIMGVAAGYRGIVVLSCDDVRIEDCRVVNMVPGVSTGAGFKANGSTVVVRDCVFQSCVASGEGAGYDGINGSSIVEGCLFDSCEGGGAVLAGLSGTTGAVRDCVFRNNTGNSALAVLLMPQAEIANNVFEGNSTPINAAALVVTASSGHATVEDNLFACNTALLQSSVVSWSTSGMIRGNTFYGNTSPVDRSVFSANGSWPTLVANNIFAGSIGGPAYRAWVVSPQASCNLFWSNPGGDYRDYIPSPTDLFVDPRFCDPLSGDFRLMSDSPCLPENSATCGLIGAFGNGCGTVSVDPSSWARLKNGYR